MYVLGGYSEYKFGKIVLGSCQEGEEMKESGHTTSYYTLAVSMEKMVAVQQDIPRPFVEHLHVDTRTSHDNVVSDVLHGNSDESVQQTVRDLVRCLW